ncbi:BAG domain-containing protein Samui-like [Octopus sinensis]|uniref:BAG domain-containing protein Samui-like n=1 Tax=Octopus sinensis TaxID=2607531 RepID=A0A6P7TJ69_9MOLL|nr:BAG domain-containing protein Samui-like [Octopus sinensis]
MVEIPVNHEMSSAYTPQAGYSSAQPRQIPVHTVPTPSAHYQYRQQAPPPQPPQQGGHQYPGASEAREIPIQHVGSNSQPAEPPRQHYTTHFQHTPAFNYPHFQGQPHPTNTMPHRQPQPPASPQQQQQPPPTHPQQQQQHPHPQHQFNYQPGQQPASFQGSWTSSPSHQAGGQNAGERVIPIVRHTDSPGAGSPQTGRKPPTQQPPTQGVYMQGPQTYAQPHHEAGKEPAAKEGSPKEHELEKPLSPLETVEKIVEDAKELGLQVNMFKGSKKDKNYKYLEEMLTRMLLKLDNIQAGSDDSIRQARKHAVNTITQTLDLLELKGMSGEDNKESEMRRDADRTESAAPPTDGNVPEKSGSSEKKEPGCVREMMLDSEVAC